MVYFFCALYEEAQFLIEAFQLKKNPEIHAFPIYESRKEMHPELTLVITGPGAIPAATAVGYLAARDDRREEGLLINIGSCGSGEKFPVGTVTLGNKLWDESTGRSCYPDILFRHPFREVEIHTGSKPASAKEIITAENVVFDMEAAAVYQAGSRFYRPDQMLFLKVVSDHGMGETARQEYRPGTMHSLMSGAKEELLPFFNHMMEKQPEKETEERNPEAERLKEELHCSVTMAAEVEQLVRYAKLAGTALTTILEEDRAAGILPCRDKKEGKGYLAQLKRRVL